MNWDMVGALAEAAGALGVILTLIYLTVQIRQNSKLIDDNRKAVTAQSTRDVELFIANYTFEAARDPEIRKIVENMVAYDNGESIDDLQWYAMRNFMLSLALAIQSQWVNRETGIGFDESTTLQFRILRGLIEGNAAWRRLWEDEALTFPAGFREAVMSIEDAPVLDTDFFFKKDHPTTT